MIRYAMRVGDLEDDRQYAALSYTWGNPITVYEDDVLDVTKDAINLPFIYQSPSPGPDGDPKPSHRFTKSGGSIMRLQASQVHYRSPH
jgi:hypothetical protein